MREQWTTEDKREGEKKIQIQNLKILNQAR